MKNTHLLEVNFVFVVTINIAIIINLNIMHKVHKLKN